MFCRPRPGLCHAGRAAGTGRALDIGGLGHRRRGRVLDGPAPGPLAGPRRRAGLARPGRRRFPGIACHQRGRAMAFRPSRFHRRRDAGPGRIRHRPLVARSGAACARRNGGRICETGAWFVALALLARFPVVAIRLPQRDRTHAAGCPRHRGAGIRRRGAPAPAPAGLGGQRFRLAPSRLAGAPSGPGLSPPRPRTRCCR